MADLGEQLVEQQNGFKIKMKELEDNILYKLATAEGLPPPQLPTILRQSVSFSSAYCTRGDFKKVPASLSPKQRPHLLKTGFRPLSNVAYVLHTSESITNADDNRNAGDITEDVELIEGLEETKRIATDIEARSALAKETQVGDQSIFIRELEK